MNLRNSSRSDDSRRIRSDFSALFPPNFPNYTRRFYPQSSLFPSFLGPSHSIFEREATSQWPGTLERFRIAGIPNTSTSRQPHSYRQPQPQGVLSEDPNQAVDSLRKIVYDPMPKKIARRLSSYYKNRTSKDTLKDNEESGSRCSVCLEDFEAKEVVMMTPCDHMFHEECIIPWLKSNDHCPVCRFKLTSKSPSSHRGASANEDLNWFLLAIEDAFARGNPTLI